MTAEVGIIEYLIHNLILVKRMYTYIYKKFSNNFFIYSLVFEISFGKSFMREQFTFHQNMHKDTMDNYQVLIEESGRFEENIILCSSTLGTRTKNKNDDF